MTLLAIDIGNTTTKLGLFDELELISSFRLSTVQRRSADEHMVIIQGLIDISSVNAVIVSSVVPPAGTEIKRMCRRTFNFDPVFVEPFTYLN